jgi:uncharacterized membrane protein (UPF0136 family)
MKTSAWIILAYGLLVLVGGMIGYQKAHSVPSLIAGSVSAGLLLACAFGMFRNSVLAYYLSIALTFALSLFFIYRFAITGNFMPAGMMTVISICAFAFVVVKRKVRVA